MPANTVYLDDPVVPSRDEMFVRETSGALVVANPFARDLRPRKTTGLLTVYQTTGELTVTEAE